MKAPPVCWSR